MKALKALSNVLRESAKKTESLAILERKKLMTSQALLKRKRAKTLEKELEKEVKNKTDFLVCFFIFPPFAKLIFGVLFSLFVCKDSLLCDKIFV